MQAEIEKYFDRLWPITRSLTGNGNRETLSILSEIVPLNIIEIPSGTTCLDWIVPPEWNVREAWIKDSRGNEVVNFKNHNLHLVGYSIPVNETMSFDALREHLYTLAEQPDVIPYVTSYYKKHWGFCLEHNRLLRLDPTEQYQVYIDSTLNEQGSLTMGETILKGEVPEEIFFSTYICHPSMANNELSGPLVTAFLYHKLRNRRLRYTYRFLFCPETIGAICYLALKGNELMKKMKAGFVVTTIGDSGSFTYKKSRQGNTLTDRATELVLKQTLDQYTVEDFFPFGSDERQYCSPGFNLPVGSLMRTRYGKYKEYHTSADNKNFIDFAAMEASVEKYLEVIDVIESNGVFVNQLPFGEVNLGKRGLYPTVSSGKNVKGEVEAIFWLLNLSDGGHDLIEIAERSGIPFSQLCGCARKLVSAGLLKVVNY